MHSITRALLWELAARGRVAVPVALLSALFNPAVIYAAFSRYGVDPRSDAMLMLQIGFLQLTFVLAAFGVWQAQGPIRRLYAMPISNAKLVAWHLLSGCVLSAVLVALVASILNIAYGAGWAVQGPALFAAALWGIACWLFSSARQSVFSLVLGLVAGAMLLVWLKTRYGPLNLGPQYPWSTVTPGEALTLVLVIAGAYGMTLLEVSRNRSGEVLLTLGLRQWLAARFNRLGRRFSTVGAPFRSPVQAQLWYEWRRGGTRWIPVIVAGVWVLVGLLVLTEYRVASFRRIVPISMGDWHIVALTLSYPLLLMLSLFGLVKGLGAAGRPIQQQQTLGESLAGKSRDPMAPFLATRPLGDTTIAWSVLQSIALALISAWAVWLSGYALFLTVAAVRGEFDGSWFARPRLPWIALLLVFVPWAVSANLAAGGLAGRPRWIGFSLLAVVACASLIPAAAPAAFPALVTLTAVGVIGTAVLIFRSAKHNRLIGNGTVIASAAAATALAAALLGLSPLPLGVMICATMVALAALVVLPVAAAPSAVNMNRHS